MNHSFDLGETIFGKQVNSLKLGCDCLGEIYYFDFDQVDELGNPLDLSQIVCMHEEDYGTGDGGTGNDSSTATLKLAVEF